MGHAMNSRHEMRVKLSGFAPIGCACLAHGSDLA
jgi:hypothetical protein